MAEPAPHTHEPVDSTMDGQPHQDRTRSTRGRFDNALAVQQAVGNRAFDNALGAAQPLDEPVRRVMEDRFGTDFGEVRVHTGASATRSADALHANAYTVGNQIVLGNDSMSHVDTLAHELAHVVQQRGGTGGPAQSGTLEADADQAAGAVTAGRPAAVAGRAAPGVARIDKSARQAAPVPAVAVMYEYVDENGKHQQVSAEELAELRKQAGDRLRGKLRRARESAENNRSTHDWFNKKVHGKAESFGDIWNNPQALIGIAVDIRSGVVPPPITMWDHAIGLAKAGEQALADGNLSEAARLLGMAASAYRDSVGQWNAYMDAIQEGGTKLVGELEIVRDVSFAIAITAAVIVAAPVIATGVAGLGATGALATGATMIGTGLVGAGAGAGLRAGADAASQKIVEGEVRTGTVWKEAKRGAKEGLVTGLTAGTAAGLGSAAGVGAEGLTFGQQLARRAVVEGGASAVGQATEAVAEGRSAGEVLEAGAIGFGMGAVTSPIGAGAAKLSSTGRTRIAKGLEIGGAAVVAGGATVATGGAWREAAKNASIAAASTAGLSGARAPGKVAKSTAPPAKKPAAAPKPSTVPADIDAAVERSFVESPPTSAPAKRPPLRRPAKSPEAAQARADFPDLRPEYAQRLGVQPGGQVHHGIELQALSRFGDVFTPAELNAFENMRGIRPEEAGRRQFHNSKIREVWDRHYRNLDAEIDKRGLVRGTPEYREYARRYLLMARAEMDHVYGPLFSEARLEAAAQQQVRIATEPEPKVRIADEPAELPTQDMDGEPEAVLKKLRRQL